MPRLEPATVASVAVTAALVTLAATLADPAGDGLPSLSHRLIVAGSLVAAVASSISAGLALGQGTPGDARPSMAAQATPSPADPVAAQVQAEAMARAETEFLATMSHELRTPLNAVIGFAELILSEVHGALGDRRYVDYVSHIRTGGERVLSIVDATLDLSQLAAGQLELRPRRVEPQAIVEECAQSVAAQAEAAKVELVVRPSTVPPIAADPDRLKQALTNLLSNAITFSGQDGRVSIGATGHGDAVAFEVTDTGTGMTPDQVVVAMQPFRSIDGSMTRRHSGIGLGLPLAERLVRLHGGELRIDSRPGCGTAVTAILPACACRLTGER
ncbi:MAG: HAMP domain-containing sensor histidine kinase [Thalassobaculum sp.]|uniref:sensor histidine kinase n=1 Tax=Thalassobaculum sp. TaxID=2022740 RepID=UPI0032EEA203